MLLFVFFISFKTNGVMQPPVGGASNTNLFIFLYNLLGYLASSGCFVPSVRLHPMEVWINKKKRIDRQVFVFVCFAFCFFFMPLGTCVSHLPIV